MADEQDDDEWKRWWDARTAAMEAVLGKMDEMVGHATIPFDLGADIGGAADIVCFRNHVPGMLSVTSELIGRDDQRLNALGNYELAVCHRDDEQWGPNLISRLAHYTLRAELNPGETMDVGPSVPGGSTITALMFLELARFEVLGRRAGILLCIGITADELAGCRAGHARRVETALREKGIYPYTDLVRPSVYRAKKWGLF